MVMDTVTTPLLAAAQEAKFETATRDDGTRYVRKVEGVPEWVKDCVYAAHGGPNRYVYRFVSKAFDCIREASVGDALNVIGSKFASGFDVYTADLLMWLSSDLTRVELCDEAVEDRGETEADLVRRIQLGQYRERENVFSEVLAACEARATEILEGWEDEARQAGVEHATNAASWLDADSGERRAPTPASLAREITGDDDVDADTVDALTSAYEDGLWTELRKAL